MNFKTRKKTRRLERKVARRLQRKTHAVIAKFAHSTRKHVGFTPQFITKLIDNIYYRGKYAARKVYNLRHRQYEVLDSILTTSRFAKPKKCCNLLGTNQHLPFSTLKITGAFSFLRKEKCTWRLYRVHFLLSK